MDYCTECGTKIVKEHKFCSKCGKEITLKNKSNLNLPQDHSKIKVWSWLLVVLILGVVGVGGFLFIDAIITGGSITGGVIHTIQPPNPKVISVNCNNYGTGILDMDQRTKVQVTVQNLGGGGNIQVVGKLDQEGTEFDLSDSKTVYLGKNKVQVVTFDFDSSSFRSGQCLGYAYSS